jgi:leucyl aminopeptidase (aminopeptidase T)
MSGDVTVLSDRKSWSRLASKVISRTLGLRRGKSVVIKTFPHTLQFAEILSVEAWKLGVHPVMIYVADPSLTNLGNFGIKSGSRLSPPEAASIANCDGFVHLASSPEDVRRRGRLSGARHRALVQYEREIHEVLVRNAIPSAYLMAADPTKKTAHYYGVDPARWTRECLRGSSVDPQTLQNIARPLAHSLQRGHTVTITHPNGTHLELGLVGRKPYLDDGTVDERDLREGHIWTALPSGLLVVPVDERVAEGRLVSNRPSQHSQGSMLDIQWTFRRGRLDHYELGTGRELFEQAYLRAGRERDRPAVLTIGVNPEVRDLPRAEDEGLGVVTVHIGHNDDFGGRTRGTFRAFAIVEHADLLVDDVPVLRGGREV